MDLRDPYGHDYKRESRGKDPDMEYRMRCACGKRSRWSVTSQPVQRAQDKHADDVARNKKYA